MSRYARQIQLPDVGPAGQARLARAHVAVIGAGGLGCPVLVYLAGAGVGRITIYDPDVIEESNLHRQPVFGMADLGRPKAEVAREALLARNPDVAVTAHVAAVGPSNAPQIVEMADLVVDAADSFAVSYILSDVCLATLKPLISASVLAQSGYVGGFCGGAPSLRAVFPDPPNTGATCASAGVLGPAVGVIGALQAHCALRVLLQAIPSPLGQMVTADLAALTFGGFDFSSSCEPDFGFHFVSRHMLRDDDLVVELRDKQEAPDKITTRALRLGPADVPKLTPAPSQRTVLCCQSGLRAWRAAELLNARGVRDLALLAVRAAT